MLTHVGTKIIETERLILRKFKYTDDDSMISNWISDPNIQLMYGEPTYETNEDVKDLLNDYITSYKNKNFYRWAITLKNSDECIGQIAYFLVNEQNNFAEIEYCIGSKFQNKGYATEATQAIIDYGFDEINLHKVQISHKSINEASQKVINKCGFIYEGTLRDYFYVDGEYYDRVYYSIIKPNPFEIKSKRLGQTYLHLRNEFF